MKTEVTITALWLRREGAESEIGESVVLAEIKGKWVEIMRERHDGPFSHIVEGRRMVLKQEGVAGA